MKKLLILFIAFIASFTLIAQDAQLFDEAWYLRSLTIEDETTYAPYQENLNVLFEEINGENSAFANGIENGFSG